MKIILIEDEEMLRRSLAFFLRSQGYEVVEFDNGEDAINHIILHHQDIRLIITDLNLPFAGGKQVLHASKDFGNIRKVVLTSQSVETNEVEVFDLGADDFIAKPFSPQALLRRIEKMIL
ncbi:response regulator transcription factor [Edaphocola flava]|jgi:DNA-binding response OmpR family regulator|uniref:response regulator transcription factor n=1 Tax=Edaphocola flava TaxID=2499629 RepID=UPI00100B33D2|nr:response regulator [Edaphocola flava]